VNKQQADYCDKLQSGNIEVAVPFESSMSLADLVCYTGNLAGIDSGYVRLKDCNLAFTETTVIVNDILTGLGK